ncbi:hypothetical protein MKZ38_006945 [Zalerion maritima]|uniref:Protein IVY1 n=1 Tax=Zalerion maritima TaxID=339359 RepID=A0AAD5RWY5_9PEZI|nr:hypothetical protein MKZ38_006945 [Zalerion maritima]
MASNTGERSHSPSLSQLPPVPGSPTYSYASTANPITRFSLPPPPPPPPPHLHLTKQDLARSQEAYSDLISSAKVYRQALATLSTAASSFGSALESCARLKEARAERTGTIPVNVGMTTSFTTSPSGTVTADTLLSASGLHHLISNHQQILSETVYRSFEVPLLHDLDKWKHATTSESDSYKLAVKNASKEISKMEKEGAKLQKGKRRDVRKLRDHLTELTGKLDGLSQLGFAHSMTLLRESQDTSMKITDAACSLVRAEVEIFEALARKGWTGGGLEDVLEQGTDLFAAEDVVTTGVGVVGSGEGLFSILPPKSILAGASASPEKIGNLNRPAGHGRTDSLLSDPTFARHSNDDDSLFDETRSHHIRRPFSPQPIRKAPTDVTYDTLEGGLGLGEPSGSSSQTKPIRQESSPVVEHDEARDREDRPLLSGHEESAPQVIDHKLGTRPYSMGHKEDDHPWRDEGIPGKGGGEHSPAVDSQSEGKQSSSERWTTVRHSDGD